MFQLSQPPLGKTWFQLKQKDIQNLIQLNQLLYMEEVNKMIHVPTPFGTLLDISTDRMKEYRILLEKILGSTTEESRETQEALEGFTPAEIREAVKLYRRGHSK